jgi:hypothetical protein
MPSKARTSQTNPRFGLQSPITDPHEVINSRFGLRRHTGKALVVQHITLEALRLLARKANSCTERRARALSWIRPRSALEFERCGS